MSMINPRYMYVRGHYMYVRGHYMYVRGHYMYVRGHYLYVRGIGFSLHFYDSLMVLYLMFFILFLFYVWHMLFCLSRLIINCNMSCMRTSRGLIIDISNVYVTIIKSWLTVTQCCSFLLCMVGVWFDSL
jgi:hypothetical protein